jgi:hypothetical protein
MKNVDHLKAELPTFVLLFSPLKIMVRICGRKELKSKIPVQSSAVLSSLLVSLMFMVRRSLAFHFVLLIGSQSQL